MEKTLYYNISKLYTLAGGPKSKDQLQDCGILMDAWLTVEKDKIVNLGVGNPPDEIINRINLQGKVVVPGFIDAHTHLVFAGDRSNEYPAKILGKSYLEILRQKGGILSSVQVTRKVDKTHLIELAKPHLHHFLARGVTTMEIKSGYGLDRDTEVKQLEVIKELNDKQDIELIGSYLGAHALPQEFSSNKDYLDYCVKEVFPLVKSLAKFCDIFLDEGVFNYEESENYLHQASDYGFKIKMHIDEINNLMGSELAVKFKATSVDHCIMTEKKQIERLAKADIPIVLLPVTSFNLQKNYAKAKLMRDSGVVLALGSDYNPGSNPCDDYLLTLRFASRVYGLLAEEVLNMATINAAKALDLQDSHGSLEIGKQADFLVLDCLDFNQIIARMDFDPLLAVYKKGEKVYL